MQTDSPSSSSYVDIQARAIQAQFATRPTLRSVVAQMLGDLITEKTAPLDTDIALISVATPNALQGYDLNPLIDVALNYMAGGDAADFSKTVGDRASHLVSKRGTRVRYLSIDEYNRALTPDMQFIETILLALPSIVHIGFQQALTDYWNAAADTGVSHWQWLGEMLRNSLRTASLQHSEDDPERREMLTGLVDHPRAEERAGLNSPHGAIHTYCLETIVTKGQLSATFQASAILVVRGQRVLLCTANGAIESYTSMDAFGEAWGKSIGQRFDVESTTWKRYEPDGNVFDIQAALLLNQQLEDLAAFRLPARVSKSELEHRFNWLTDLAPLFCSTATSSPSPGSLRLVQTVLPEWLKRASAADQLAYRKHTLELASLNQAAEGKSWTDDIDDIRVFTVNALQQQMLKDQPLAPAYNADELELTFHVPVGDLGSGYIQPVKMTLTDLALKNLSGRPKGRMTLRTTDGPALQDWVTSQYLFDLITQVDVGRTYPQRIKDLLLGDTDDAQKRQRLYAAELRVALPMQALEHVIKGEYGLTQRGYQFITALMHTTYADRVVNGQEVVIRPLAFLRKAGAPADVAINMFVIEPRDNSVGPHILYRPIYKDSLHEYPTREALFAAIAVAGAIQTSVLDWLPEPARPIYDHGGFNEPHIVHFTQLDPFGMPEKPKAATLANAEGADELLLSLQHGALAQYLFGCEARALVDQGDRNSVSSAESRWAILMEGGWTLFNTLLALPISSPIMMAGWMISMTSSLIDNIAELDSQNPTARESAWFDLLMNIALLLLHGAQKPESRAEPITLEGLEKNQVTLQSMRRSVNRPFSDTSLVRQSAIGLPSEPPGGGKTLLDFDKSVARDSSATRLLEKLRAYNVQWPKELPEPIAIGPYKGLYKIGHQWHASIAGLLFRAAIAPGFGEVYVIHPRKPDHPGFKLKTDGRGHWTLDRGLKLLGGGPKKRIAAKQEENLRKLEELYLEKQPAQGVQIDEVERYQQAMQQFAIARNGYAQHIKTLELIWTLLERADARQKPALLSRRATELEKTANAWSTTLSTLETLQARVSQLEQTRRQLIDFSRRENEFDKTNSPTVERAKLFAAIASTHLIVQNSALNLSIEYLTELTEGEPFDDLAKRVETDLGAGELRSYQTYIRALEADDVFEEHIREWSRRFESTLNEMQADSAAGAREHHDLLKATSSSQVLNEFDLKLQNLDYLRELSVDRNVPVPLAFKELDSTQAPLEALRDTASAHFTLRTDESFTFQQRQAVLETIIHRYQKAEDASLVLKEIAPSFSRPVYFQRFIDDLRLLRQGAESDLAELILRQEDLPIATPRTRQTRPQSTVKRVFKTRNHGTLIGELQASRHEGEGEVMEVHNPFNNQTVSRYHKHAEEDVYVQIIEQPRQPVAVTRSENVIVEAGNKLLAQRIKLEALIDREMAQALRDPVLREEKTPADWETMLVQSAGDLEGLVTELQKTPGSSSQKTALLGELASAAQAMRTKGRDYRIAGYKLQSPTPEKVDYLWTHHAIDIEPVNSRKPTQAKDFLTEFAIKDKHSREVLWYAHFHYTRIDGPTDAYTAGHLKRPDQRFAGFKAQLSQAKNNREITRIWRSKISPAMAKKLFFYD
ncbi:dermonecrotic toxin domain-containing protein [Pseudomonas sp. NPDC087697]|uniref:dermonecrotic toxin domain-containing protein n=1 Tax=Pseudomonas sp. NPDC087697 TaxID=3364447 RepID=UPI003806DE18